MMLTKYKPTPIENGYSNHALMVDLTKESAQVEPISPEMREKFVGGRGYAIRILYDRARPDIDPLGPENIFIISPGPMTGEYRWPGGTKTVIASLSPATNGYGEASVEGRAGEKLKQSGFDLLCITGKAKTPQILVIDGPAGEIRIEDAPPTEDALELGKHLILKYGKYNTGVFDIGVAGRKLVRMACINAIHALGNSFIPRQADRTGLGAVMGSKNLIAIVAVASTNQIPSPADEHALLDVCSEMKGVITQNDKYQMNFSKMGTAYKVDFYIGFDCLPYQNFSPSNKDEVQKISATEFLGTTFQRSRPCCPGCNLSCAKQSRIFLPDGQEKEVDGPEYDTIAMLGSNLGIFDPYWVAEGNYLCDVLGLDTISTGNLIAYAMECFKRGYLTTAMTGGLELKFGNTAAARQLIPLIARREGFGEAFGQGFHHLVDSIFAANGGKVSHVDLESFAYHVKNLEFSAYIPRFSLAQQVAFGTSLIGAHDSEAFLITIEARNQIPTYEDKAKALVFYQTWRTWFDIVGACKLGWIHMQNPASKDHRNLATLQLFVRAINAVTGVNRSLEDHFALAARAYTMAKLINLRRGLGRKEDHVPNGMMGSFSMEEYDRVLDKYYEMRGWDYEGVPLPKTLATLGIL